MKQSWKFKKNLETISYIGIIKLFSYPKVLLNLLPEFPAYSQLNFRFDHLWFEMKTTAQL